MSTPKPPNPELRRVTLSREQRDLLAADDHTATVSHQIAAAWDAAEPLPCPACNGTGLTDG